MLRTLWIPLALGLASTACGFVDAGAKPVVEAHRFGATEAPQNGRAALKNALAKDWKGVEFDLVLTKDRVPVVSHDPWVNQEHCTRADGTALPPEKDARVNIADLSADELRAGYVCGGVVDPENPDALVVAEPMMTLDEVIDELRAAPEVLVHLDVKYEPEWTAGPEVFAEEILKRWRAAALPNPWYVSANLPALIRAFEALQDDANVVPTSLIWPRFPPDSESQQVSIALSNEVLNAFGFQSLLQLANDAQADGLCIAYQVADRQMVESARAAGLKVQLWTLNSPALLETYCRWPLDGLITDMPEAAPCR